MHYREYPPIPPLAHAVDRVWTLEGEAPAAGAADPVLPDGRPELIFHLGDPFHRVAANGSAARQARVLFAGQVTAPLLLRPSGRVAVLGIRFHPDGAAALLRQPQHELGGLTADVADLDRRLARALRAVDEAEGNVARASGLAQQALARLLDSGAADRRVRVAVAQIHGTAGRVSIDALARSAGITRRHLERRFLEAVGLTPKALARIARFQHALQILQCDSRPRNGAATALTCGYADQSHFIRDFRAFAGCPPTAHLLRQGALTGFFVA